jgi:hypothetical protein
MKEDHRTLNPFNEEDVADARLNDDDASRELCAYLPEHMRCFVWAVIRIEGGYRVLLTNCHRERMRRIDVPAQQWLTDTMAGRIAWDVP